MDRSEFRAAAIFDAQIKQLGFIKNYIRARANEGIGFGIMSTPVNHALNDLGLNRAVEEFIIDYCDKKIPELEEHFKNI